MSTHAHTVTLIPGDGIGPEVTEAALRIAEAAGARIHWERVEAGAEVIAKYGTPVPDPVLNSIRTHKVGLKGPITTPIGAGFSSANVTLRKALDLFASVRPVKSIPGVETPFRDVDLIVIRENTEGLYSGLEHRVAPGIVESLKVMTEHACTRISRYAFQLAERQGRHLVTAVHKANIMKLSDGLFLECARKVAREYPEIEYKEMIIDNCAMQLVKNPAQFDVLLMENLYGDIISDLCAGLVGGLGVVPGSNVGEQCAVFEAVHGSAPDIAGKRLANPCAVVLSMVEMLRHLDEERIAHNITRAVHATLADPANRTGDLGGKATLDQITQAIIDHLE
ncbi:MAG TPA: isocitrate dehydrogenase (NAD(+)) [Myxococcota bacterium]|jgi:isocitrate dehydrogenase (NAD+)|nr:isocitrate dehydrogenase (NAD(+)) [Myxococcota bacterium]